MESDGEQLVDGITFLLGTCVSVVIFFMLAARLESPEYAEFGEGAQNRAEAPPASEVYGLGGSSGKLDAQR